jgi:hypothetical protein
MAFSFAYNLVKLFVDANTTRKVMVTRQNTCPELLEQIAPNQLE